MKEDTSLNSRPPIRRTTARTNERYSMLGNFGAVHKYPQDIQKSGYEDYIVATKATSVSAAYCNADCSLRSRLEKRKSTRARGYHEEVQYIRGTMVRLPVWPMALSRQLFPTTEDYVLGHN